MSLRNDRRFGKGTFCYTKDKKEKFKLSGQCPSGKSSLSLIHRSLIFNSSSLKNILLSTCGNQFWIIWVYNDIYFIKHEEFQTYPKVRFHPFAALYYLQSFSVCVFKIIFIEC